MIHQHSQHCPVNVEAPDDVRYYPSNLFYKYSKAKNKFEKSRTKAIKRYGNESIPWRSCRKVRHSIIFSSPIPLLKKMSRRGPMSVKKFTDNGVYVLIMSEIHLKLKMSSYHQASEEGR